MLPGLDLLEAKTRAATQAEDPTAVLLADHDWLRDLLDEYRQLARRGERLAEVREAMLELQPRLELHIRREEEAYFPAVEEFMQEAGQGSTFDMYGEHDAIKIRLEQLLVALGRDSGAADAFGALARSLLIHFENEEELIFAEAPQHLTEQTRREVTRKFEALERDQATG
jgi:hemerythrin-like domain-containing protein